MMMKHELTNDGGPSHAVPRRTFLALSLTAAAVGATSCGLFNNPSSPNNQGTSRQGGANALTHTFRESLAPTNHLDPAFAGSNSTQRTVMQAMIWEGLVRRDPNNSANFLPGAAESWKVSSDGLTYTFHLRQTKWSNGEPLTADDFVWSYSYYFSPNLGKVGNANPASFNGSTSKIKGLAAYYAGQTTDFSTVGVQATDKQTLVITLASPDPSLLDSTVRVYPLYQKSVEANQLTFWEPPTFVGNGPYTLTQYTQNSAATLELNKHYWNSKRFGITTRQIQFNAGGPTAQMVSYNADELDLFWVNGDPTALIAGRADLRKQLKHGTEIQFKGIEVMPSANPILQQNAKLRQALALALDRGALAKVSPPDLPGPSFVPSGITGADKLPKIPFDPKKAKQLLSAAGYADGKGVPTLQILTYTPLPLLDAVVSMWKKYLNINAQVQVQEVGVYGDMLRGNRPDSFVGYTFNYQAPNPYNMLSYGARPMPYFQETAIPFDVGKQIYNIQYGPDKSKYTPSQATQMIKSLYNANWIPDYKKYVDLNTKAQAAAANENQAIQIATQAAIALQETYLWIPLLWAGYTFMEKPRVHNLTLTSYPDDMYTLKGVTLGPNQS